MEYYIVTYNIAKAKFPIFSKEMEAFHNEIDAVNAEAEEHPGFIWRFKEEAGISANLFLYNNPNMLVNMSVWKSIDNLKNYLYNGLHLKVFMRQAEWFIKMDSPHMVLWWIRSGQIPLIVDGKNKLDNLGKDGPSQNAFDFKHLYSAPIE